MYLSRFTFHTIPGKTGEVEEELKTLRNMVSQVNGVQPRILHSHFASLGAPDIVFEQEAQDLSTLEAEINKINENPDFQIWTKRMSGLLRESPKREIYLIVD